MQLADAGFRNVEDGDDFLEIEVLFVVQAHEQLFALGQGLDRFDQGLAETVGKQGL